jgi:hypothetical protein
LSYDIRLKDRVTGNTVRLDFPHQIRGGMYAVGGTNEAWLNVTYNYGDIFRQVFGEDGIRSIYGKSGAESIPMLQKAISVLKDDATNDYWEATEGNAKKALYGLLAFAQLRPDGVWDGD